MEIKKSDIKLENFSVLACSITTIPTDTKVSSVDLVSHTINLDFDILRNAKSKNKVKILLEINSNNTDSPNAGYAYSIVAEAEYLIKNLSKMKSDTQNKHILFTAVPLAIAMVRSHLYNGTSNFRYGHYLLPSIDLPDLFNKKYNKDN
ncbi:MAG: hypothetical protein KJ571_08530 [Bacteroidetes bacterium]|nr:hypothetical protein [Bacteroidota bacterium]